MNAFKRSILYITRKKKKSLIMLFESCLATVAAFLIEIPESLVNKISKVDGIKNYDGIIGGSGMDFKNISSVDPANNMIQYNEEEYKHLFSVEGHTSTQYDTKFTSKSLRLVEGRHLVATDKNKVLIHKALAEKNEKGNRQYSVNWQLSFFLHVTPPLRHHRVIHAVKYPKAY